MFTKVTLFLLTVRGRGKGGEAVFPNWTLSMLSFCPVTSCFHSMLALYSVTISVLSSCVVTPTSSAHAASILPLSAVLTPILSLCEAAWTDDVG